MSVISLFSPDWINAQLAGELLGNCAVEMGSILMNRSYQRCINAKCKQLNSNHGTNGKWEARRKAIKASSRIILCYMQRQFLSLFSNKHLPKKKKKKKKNRRGKNKRMGKTEVQRKSRERKYLVCKCKMKNGRKKQTIMMMIWWWAVCWFEMRKRWDNNNNNKLKMSVWENVKNPK